MKANELMIGDYVIRKNVPKEILVVYTIDSIRNVVHLDLDGLGITEKLENIEPIPITPEILEKNGFEEEVREGDPTFPYSAFILDGDDYRIEITWYDSHDRYEPNTGQFLGGVPEVWAIEVNSKRSNVDIERNKMYVHELQHALRLCGITKEIEL